ncbi:MAG: phosphatidylinositol kinase [Acidimicrobiia bacterium]|nr:phosphatidylinositol kinase [Acidimicrobiia bacterium]
MDHPLSLTGIVGRYADTSNLTLLATDEAGSQWVYKAESGERPLWDFPRGSLWRREIAFYLLDRALGFGVVPETVEANGPMGMGSAQQHVSMDNAFDPRTLLDPPDERFWPIAILDVIANNADRKLGHVLVDGGSLWAIDNGLTFHPEEKLRTVLWMLAGEEIPHHYHSALQDLLPQLEDDLGAQLLEMIGQPEMGALASRTKLLIETGVHPEPPQDRHALPWPLY